MQTDQIGSSIRGLTGDLLEIVPIVEQSYEQTSGNNGPRGISNIIYQYIYIYIYNIDYVGIIRIWKRERNNMLFVGYILYGIVYLGAVNHFHHIVVPYILEWFAGRRSLLEGSGSHLQCTSS